MPVPTPTTPAAAPAAPSIQATEDELARVRYTTDGLVPAIVQDAASGAVLMMAWMTEETLRLQNTVRPSASVSRSRREVWRKGEPSGEVQLVREARYDCDGDTLLLVVDQQGGGACHTGNRSCFFRAFGAGAGAPTA